MVSSICLVLGAIGAPSRAAGQSAPARSASASRVDDEQTIKLSIFEVRGDDDVGYQAMNTTSGSRLGTALRDTAASISPVETPGRTIAAATS